MQAENCHQGNSERGNEARLERHEHNGDQIKKGDRTGLEVEPDGGKRDECQADDAKRKLFGGLAGRIPESPNHRLAPRALASTYHIQNIPPRRTRWPATFEMRRGERKCQPEVIGVRHSTRKLE